MKAPAILFVLVFAMTALISCSQHCDDELTVAENFWSAMEARDIELARSYATDETANSVTIKDDAGDEEADIQFGDVTHEDGQALVATMIKAVNDDGSEMEMAMQTVLVKQNGEWKVDVDQTFMSLFGGAMGAMMEQMGEAMQQGMEDMGKAMVEGMENSFSEIEQSSDSDDD